ncbi:family 16 glycosylhydrolase [uncultured Nocardioides sp.]|uniref:family 16 glycosylhydrolase n=1 Tax=uncultured Nocardioides sp. TaxID=198441 RepID=UPI002612F0E6|nr:family 16 glycosylhydrolase [uncultured Nocardioides sp.]
MSLPSGSSTHGDTRRRVRRLLAASSAALVVAAGTVSTEAAATTVPSTGTLAGAPLSSAAQAVEPGVAEGDWKLLDTEDFTTLDRDRWHVYDSRSSGDASHTFRPWRAKVRKGALRLSGGSGKNGVWSSGTVGGWGWDAGNLRQGRVDMRVMTAAGAGVETNLMLWPDSQSAPPALELYSSPATWGSRQQAVQQTHFRKADGTSARKSSTRRGNFTQWRTFSVRWDASRVIYLIDGVVTRIDRTAELLPTGRLWPLLQTVVHRNAQGRVPASAQGATTSIDWIKVYDWKRPDVGTEPEEPTDPEPPTEPTGDWVSVGRDDFNGNALDTSRWTTFSGTPGCCGDTVWQGSQVQVSNGELVLHNRMTPDGWRSGGVGGWKWKETVRQYGRIDARIRFDKGTGFSAAALTWPTDGSWPPEIDFYEIYESRGNRDMMAQSTHYKSPSSATGRGVDQKFNHGMDFSKYHTVSMRWAADELSYWIDGQKVHTVRDVTKIPHKAMWIGFQTHVHKMNGQWPSMPAGQDTVALRVDYVEVFKQR